MAEGCAIKARVAEARIKRRQNDMKSFIENHIDWQKLAPHERGEFLLSVEQASLVEETLQLNIDIAANFVIPYENLKEITDALCNEIEDLKDVSFRFRYEKPMAMSEEEIMKISVPHMINNINDLGRLRRTMDMENVDIEDGNMVVYALGEQAVRSLNMKAAPVMQSMLKHDFGIERMVFFRNKEEEYARKVSELQRQTEEEVKRLNDEAARTGAARARAAGAQTAGTNAGGAQTAGPGASKTAAGGQGGGFSGGAGFRGGYAAAGGARPGSQRKRGYEGPVVGDRIVGKPISGTVINLKEVNKNSGVVVIEGSVFRTEYRTIKGDRRIASLYVTDNTDSILVKMFISPQKQADFEEHIKTGTYLRIKGEAQFDSFERMTVLMAQSIEKAEKRQRMDTSERKHIELHAHTKMSQIDGIMDVADLINTAKAWGHPAVAVTDHGVVQAFPDAMSKAKGIKVIYGVEGYLVEDIPQADGTIDYKTNPSRHIILLARSQAGIKNLYKLVSYSFVNYHYKKPRMPRSEIIKHREGIIIGSACEAGELFRAIVEGKSDEELEKIAAFYDYLEIQPRCNNRFMLKNGTVETEEELLDFNRKVLEIGRKLGKPVVATCDAHYLNKEDYIYRNIIMAAHGFKDLSDEPNLYLKTTDELLEEFAYLGPKEAERVVIDDTHAVAAMIDDDIKPLSDEKCPPFIEGSEERLKTRCYDKAHEIYGDPLPEIVEQRLEKELNSIIGNGYAVMYVAAEMLVQKSLSDGYLVGSRGSVGSSFAATMDGITEVNPLPPHYICPNKDCKHSEFPEDYSSDCGVDLPDKNCPICGTKYIKEGHNIPFEVFLGFKGDKEPDIDLNFASEYQPVAHKYVEEIFGAENVYRAGTIGTIKEKTALVYVKKYLEERGRIANKCEMERLALGCSGVRKTSGQHPGGMVVVPRGREIYEFCPVMHPAEGQIKDTITTHFDYHKIEKNLLKLDILGHEVPMMIRMLEDITGVPPEKIPLRDEKVNAIFLGTDTLDIKIDNYRQKHGTFGIPEFGTSFTRQMLDDTQPKRFSDLVRIAGFSHGTDVWLNNAQEFIRSGVATMDDAIATRDDIMNYLISKGLPKQDSFTIMERVRKGKSITEEQEALMLENDVPDWYIESCKRIKYMFPKAHAVAYVMMSYRIAYFKVYYPTAFYAVHFSMKIDAFNAKVCLGGMDAVTDMMDQIKSKGNDASNKEKDEFLVYEVVYEMYARGYEFLPPVFGKSKAVHFSVEDGKIRVPFRALEGMGETAAVSLAAEYENKPFSSIEDMMTRTSVNSSNLEVLREMGVVKSLPESDQLSMFSQLGIV